jgi:spermidine/putrescine transport system substrate-binding protein
MWAMGRQFRTVGFCALVLAFPLGTVAACGGTSMPAAAPQATVSSTAGDDLVLFAQPRLIAAAGFDQLGRQSVAGDVMARPYASGEDMLVDLAAGRRADVVEVCSNESAERLARQGLLQPLDTSRIAQWDRLYPVLKDLPGVVVDGKVYMVPLTAAVTGILYDPAVASTPPDSFGDLFARRYKGHLGFADDAALAFQIAALDLGLPDAAALSAEQALQAEIYLKHYKKNYRSFWHDLDNLARAFRGGRVTVAVGDRRDALELQRRGAPVAFALAAEGQPLVACGLAITTQARDLDAAYALIDYLLRPDSQAALATAAGDLVANQDAARLVRPAERARLGLTDLARLDRPVARVPSLEHLDWIQAWYEVKKGRG